MKKVLSMVIHFIDNYVIIRVILILVSISSILLLELNKHIIWGKLFFFSCGLFCILDGISNNGIASLWRKMFKNELGKVIFIILRITYIIIGVCFILIMKNQ
jgi:Na+/H+ antiporter NhaD/arsenite permease-like protein